MFFQSTKQSSLLPAFRKEVVPVLHVLPKFFGRGNASDHGYRMANASRSSSNVALCREMGSQMDNQLVGRSSLQPGVQQY